MREPGAKVFVGPAANAMSAAAAQNPVSFLIISNPPQTSEWVTRARANHIAQDADVTLRRALELFTYLALEHWSLKTTLKNTRIQRIRIFLRLLWVKKMTRNVR